MSHAGIEPDDGWVRRKLKRERESGRITFLGLAGETRVGSVGPIVGWPDWGRRGVGADFLEIEQRGIGRSFYDGAELSVTLDAGVGWRGSSWPANCSVNLLGWITPKRGVGYILYPLLVSDLTFVI